MIEYKGMEVQLHWFLARHWVEISVQFHPLALDNLHNFSAWQKLCYIKICNLYILYTVGRVAQSV
jgi:hypothetical protein